MAAELPTLEIAYQQHEGDDVFPLVIDGSAVTTIDAMRSWITERQANIEKRLARHGALLFRGLPLASVGDFDAFIRTFGYENFRYRDSLSNAVRVNKTERVFTANEAPPDVEIFMHHEMAQTPVYPSRLIFYCDKPAEKAGATPLCRSDWLWRRIVVELQVFAGRIRTRGLRYANRMPADDDAESGQGRSWTSTFHVATREQAEGAMMRLGYDWHWNRDGSLIATTPTLDAVRVLDGGDEAFFNQLIAAFKGWANPECAVRFGDGSSLDTNAVATLCALADAMAFDIPWQAGDVALIDNYRVMHGRRPFEGTRRVLASLVAA